MLVLEWQNDMKKYVDLRVETFEKQELMKIIYGRVSQNCCIQLIRAI